MRESRETRTSEMMLTEEQIRDAIRERLRAARGSCNSAHIHHTDGVMRGLIWALTGKDPGTYLVNNVPRMLEMADIPHRVVGGEVFLEE